jgi:hypothetical protein
MSISFSGRTTTIPYDATTHLLILWTLSQPQAYSNYCSAHTATNPSPTVPANLTAAQLIKLRWHNRLNHVGFDQLTNWMRDGTISVPPAVINCPNPVCPACLFGKVKRRPHAQHTDPIDSTHKSPGAGVSADQFGAGAPGIVPTIKGSPTKLSYKYCNFWVDNYSRLIYVTMHATKDQRDLMQSKTNFETFCKHHGVSVHAIRADNGIYASQSFRTSCSDQTQQLTYCGIGSHWQNGIAERAIGLIQSTARTILLHAMAKWPTIINESCWPFAIRHSVYLYNITCRRGQRRSPWELFTGVPPTKHPSDSRIFGCPAFVLNKDAQDNPSLVKTWTSRCWQGIYVGFSPMHASTVSMIYNPSTRHVTLQFHVTYDKDFTTVSLKDPAALEARLHALFKSKATWQFVDSHGDPHPYFFDEPALPSLPSPLPQVHLAHATSTRHRALYKPYPCSDDFRHWKDTNHVAADLYHCPLVPLGAPFSDLPIAPPEAPSNTPCAAPGPHTATISSGPTTYAATLPPPEGAVPTHPPPTVSSDGDTLTQSAMLKAHDRAEFIAAQLPEIAGLEKQGVFTYHDIATLPPQARLLNAIWSYKRKRSPTGALLKHKSRLCTDGSQQRPGIDYTDTYAPVVAWSTVRLVLALSSMLNLHTRQVDFTQAFTQFPIDRDVFMKIPQGWFVSGGNLQPHPDPTF